MNKVALIIPYFGKLPNYFNLFLYSCSKNENVDFFIFTDQIVNEKYNNVKYYKMTFNELNLLSKEKLLVSVLSPYKLCDFKVTYGKLFENYISNYEYWGYCDCDMLFGNLNLLLNETIYQYDKILTDGHLTIFKNEEKINNLYKKEYKDIINFKKAVTIKEPCFFDEIMFPIICRRNNVKTYVNKEIYADILPKYFEFKMPQNNIDNQTFVYENGKILRRNDNKEYIYIHLQKRKIFKDSNIDYDKPIYIFSNIFTNDKNYVETYDKKFKFKYYINYFKRFSLNRIKIKLLTNKIKNKEKI